MKYFSLFFFLFIISCETSIPDRINKISSGEVVRQGNEYTISGNALDTDGSRLLAYGHCWSPAATATLSDSLSRHFSLERKQYFTDTLHGLVAYQTYTIRPYLQTTGETSYGTPGSFTALPQNFPLAVVSVVALSETSLLIEANYSGTGSFYVAGTAIAADTGSGNNENLVFTTGTANTWTAQVNNLKALQEYRCRAMLYLNDTSIRYSQPVWFTIYLLNVETTGGTMQNPTTALLSGKVNHKGPVPVSEWGFCWSYLSSNPNYNHHRLQMETAISEGDFSATLHGLSSGLTYYFRSYGVANHKVYYGGVKTISVP